MPHVSPSRNRQMPTSPGRQHGNKQALSCYQQTLPALHGRRYRKWQQVGKHVTNDDGNSHFIAPSNKIAGIKIGLHISHAECKRLTVTRTDVAAFVMWVTANRSPNRFTGTISQQTAQK